MSANQATRSKILLGIIACYAVWWITTSFFAWSESVVYQTVDNVLVLLIVIGALGNMPLRAQEYVFARITIAFFFIGQALLFAYNYFVYSDFNTWLDLFNNYLILVPLYIVSLLGGMAYSEYRRSHT